MGTRSGVIDPSILEYICHERNMSIEEVTNALNKKSGLLGIATKNDLRDVQELQEKNNEDADLAVQMLKKSIIDHIAKYYFEAKGQIDAIVFTAGIGENSKETRMQIMDELSSIGVKGDSEANDCRGKFARISSDDSKIECFTIPTDEELMIAKDTYELTNC